jgi:hypothetical protein
MSQQGDASGPTERPGRYRRTSGGLTGALLVTLVAVGAFVGFRSLVTPDREVERRAVDWQAQVEVGRADDRLSIPAPRELPEGWQATAAEYTAAPSWQLALLTDEERYVGVYERPASTEALVAEHVDEDAEQGDDVELAGVTWETWTDAGGDYALAREGDPVEGVGVAVLVVGSAPPTVVRDLAAVLEPAPSAAP